MIESAEALLEKDDFTVFTPNVVDLLEKAGENPDDSRIIGGFCSTEDLDRQDEVVVAKGLDFSEFRAHGWFNDNHKQETAAALGYPDEVCLKGSRWYTRGQLIKGYGPADQIWELAKSLKKSGASRRLGFSIEGKVLERDGVNRILRAKVRHVAITASPVNTACLWEPLLKAFASADAVSKASERFTASDLDHAEVASSSVRRGMSFDEAVERLGRLCPKLSKSYCKMVVRYAQKEGSR